MDKHALRNELMDVIFQLKMMRHPSMRYDQIRLTPQYQQLKARKHNLIEKIEKV